MMNIKDLSISKELDSKALADVRGGQDITVATVNTGNQTVSSFNAENFLSPTSNLTFGVQDQTATSVVNAAEVNSYLPYFAW
jgi:hypothetical protein